MAIIYDVNYARKCMRECDRCTTLAEKSKEYYGALKNYEPKNILDKIRKTFGIKVFLVVNKISINSAKYWLRRLDAYVKTNSK